ncbi:ribosomal-protein-alanine acetyltransferase [Desulfurispirillum indicum S5]|uniref:[Ribosomal protein bS18]-alanine N-acetyltransferase n=1 Tax=Desulfurispirillum indicum (strain ATCC BAA-1389 / DSM 22839 / S5) TaxID=653733 RepID=E6W274_DESIS|nr:ribosomal protein S18-alanine N-acetyltransferase [Desulfurispirillum indicum]ADU65532.1 ribosomal-protein-alanine acetyltransferase [Desulfurispirillum indicum S5]
MSLKVRLLDQSFLRDIHAIEASRFTHPWSEQQIAEEMRHPRIIALGAFHGESLLGYLFAYLLPEELQLNNVAVHKEFSRMGIATLLLEYLEQLGKGEGCREILLEVNEKNSGAIALYEKRGFKVTGRRRKYYRDGGDAVLMQKKL